MLNCRNYGCCSSQVKAWPTVQKKLCLQIPVPPICTFGLLSNARNPLLLSSVVR